MSAQPRWEHTERAAPPVAATRGRTAVASDTTAIRILIVAAMSSIAAGAIHVAAAATLGSDSTQNLAFFGIVAFAEVAWGLVALVTAPRWWLVLGALGNAVVVITWLVSRTVGLPVGQYAGEILPVGYADVLATILGVVTLAGAAWLAVRGSSPTRAAAHARGFALAAAIVIGTIGISGIVSQANALSGDAGGRNVPTAPGGGGGYGGSSGGTGYGGY